MASVNKVILLGNCGRDPEVRYLPSGKATCSISIATSSRYKGKDGEMVEDTQWHRVNFFDKLAEVVGQYIKKGSPLYVEGRLKYSKFTNKEGVEQNTCDIIATEMQLLGSKESAPSAAPKHAAQAPAPARRPAPRNDDDSNIPF